ncbi:very short patch repair endonuclease [Endozoicomonas atrinae]|uniref:very short patch repair endonuclease n=1 Tax=Endozoicomonas atrinae TaxID=1333660 RepID=UPI003B00E7F1
MDKFSPEVRSRVMASIHGKNTKPEIIVRRSLHRLGFRYRLHRGDLPGSPDIVLHKYNAVIQINGCFWHGHNCHLYKPPRSKPDFWKTKISKNKERDKKNKAKILKLGWRLLIVWECAIQGKTKIPIDILIELIENWLTVETVNRTVFLSIFKPYEVEVGKHGYQAT